MTLSAGTQLGPYRIAHVLGVGGMGEVYRAYDSKLGRDVALKVLPAAFQADSGRLARFEREARALASLNHPNIATIYGLEQHDGVHSLVMELIEGSTLHDIITGVASGAGESSSPSAPMSISEALAVVAQIVEALDAAHERGIVHRDLKPANIKVTDDRRVKVLDFGLAKAMDSDVPGSTPGHLSHSPTFALGATSAGVILGTAAYMSPEQARGRTVDKRSDIWAFGCVLYEMLTGKLAFPGETLSDTLVSILDRPRIGRRFRRVHRRSSRGCCAGVSRRSRASGGATSAMHGSSSKRCTAASPGRTRRAHGYVSATSSFSGSRTSKG